MSRLRKPLPTRRRTSDCSAIHHKYLLRQTNHILATIALCSTRTPQPAMLGHNVSKSVRQSEHSRCCLAVCRRRQANRWSSTASRRNDARDMLSGALTSGSHPDDVDPAVAKVLPSTAAKALARLGGVISPAPRTVAGCLVACRRLKPPRKLPCLTPRQPALVQRSHQVRLGDDADEAAIIVHHRHVMQAEVGH